MPATAAPANTTTHSGNTAAFNSLEAVMIANTATQLVAGDIVFTGHGFGEAPAVVAGAGRFTARMSVVRFADGRTITVAADRLFDRGPRVGESLAGLVDYDYARDNR